MTSPRRTAALEAVTGTLALGYGLALHWLLPKRLHILTNPLAAIALTGIAWAGGVHPSEQGLAMARAGPGLTAGTRAALPVAGLIAAALAVPATRRWFKDDQLACLSRRKALYEALVRVPAATALAEEVVFRGALLGILLRRHPQGTAVAISSALFGLWHLLPGSERLDDSPAARVTAIGPSAPAPPLARAVAAAATVLATTAAGYGLAALRLRSGSILAPTMAHAAMNSASLLGGWLLARRRSAGTPAT